MEKTSGESGKNDSKHNRSRSAFLYAEGWSHSIYPFIDVRWVEVFYYKKTPSQRYWNIRYDVTTDNDRVITISREAIGDAYKELQRQAGVVEVYYYDAAAEAIDTVGQICRLHQNGKDLNGSYFWRYAQWIQKKAGCGDCLSPPTASTSFSIGQIEADILIL